MNGRLCPRLCEGRLIMRGESGSPAARPPARLKGRVLGARPPAPRRPTKGRALGARQLPRILDMSLYR